MIGKVTVNCCLASPVKSATWFKSSQRKPSVIVVASFAAALAAKQATASSKNPSKRCSNPCVPRETLRANPYGTARLRSSGDWLRMRSSPGSVMSRIIPFVESLPHLCSTALQGFLDLGGEPISHPLSATPRRSSHPSTTRSP